MTSRIAALSLGLISGLASLVYFATDWTAALAFLADGGRGGFGGMVTDAWPRVTWTAAGCTSVFAVVSLLTALVGGLIEAVRTKARLRELRYDPILADAWTAADWRAAFAHTAIANRAEAMVAAALPATQDLERRFVVDTQLLDGMEQVWLDRLALSRVISPLPSLVLSFAATTGLLAFCQGNRWWDACLAAGAAGWFVIRLTEYVVQLPLSVAVASTVEMATAALRPLISMRMITLPPQGPGQVQATAEAASRRPTLSGQPQSPTPESAETEITRERAVDAALPEIRASIERLLAGSPNQAQPPSEPD